MKNLLIFAFLLLAVTSCKNDKTGTTTETTEVKTPETNTTEIPSISNSETLNKRQTIAENSPIIGTSGAPISSQTSILTKALITDYWQMAAYLRMAKPEAERKALNKANTGRWFKMAADGTFVGGQYEEENTKGRYYYDPMGPTIYYDHENRRDEEYTVKMNADQTVMIWIGTKTFDETGVQTKLENSTGLPKRPASN